MIDFFTQLLFHLDEFLTVFIGQYGNFIYPLVFIMIFSETGLFVPFFPGDSLIFACAAFAAAGYLDIWLIVAIIFIAALLGDSLNFHFGKSFGQKLYKRAKNRFLKQEKIDAAKDFYDKYGGKAIIISRFIPLVRQCTPFVTGIGVMTYNKFMVLNLIGVTLWVGSISALGYFFGNIQIVKDNFSAVLMIIVFVSMLPAVFTLLKSKFGKKSEPDE
jgi:membrane-associated protein